MAEEARHRNGSVSKVVLEYAIKNAGILMHINTIASDTGLSVSQIRNAVRKMVEEGTTGTWEVALRGSAWIFQPPKPDREGDWRMYEIVTEVSEGLLAKNNDGELFVIKPVYL